MYKYPKNTILNDENLNPFSSSWKIKIESTPSVTTSIQHYTRDSDQYSKTWDRHKSTQILNEEVKLYLQATWSCTSKNYVIYNKAIVANKFNMVEKYKVNIKISIYFQILERNNHKLKLKKYHL